MFAKNTLASAVAAAISVSAVGAAQAGSVFFPHVVVSDTVTTIVSVMNPSALTTVPSLHYRLYYKQTETLTDPCQEYDAYLPTSPYDIQTIDLGGTFAPDTLGVMFDDPSVNNKWQQAGLSYALAENVAPIRGYLIVDDNNINTLAGEAFVFEFGSGAAWGYQAKSSASQDYRAAASASPQAVAIMPFDEINTAFLVTPIDGDQAPDFANEYRSRIEFVTTTRGDMFDRDENLISGTVPTDVVCVGRVNAADLLSDGAAARLVKGGWGYLWNYRVALSGGKWVPAEFDAQGSSAASPSTNRFDYAWDKGSVVIKLEYNSDATMNGQPVGGTYNNALMLQP